MDSANCNSGGLVQLLNDADPNNATNPREIIFTGHSLGGSTANLALYDYVVRYKTLSRRFPSSYTFGENAFVSKLDHCYWNTTYPFRHCYDNVDKFDNTPVYGYRTSTVMYNQVHNFANIHSDLLKYDPIPHSFRRFSHVGLHYTLHKTGDSLADPNNGAVDGVWRIRSSFHYQDKGGFQVKTTVPFAGFTAHNTCFYARSLEFAAGEPTFRWLGVPNSSEGQFVGGIKCVYSD